MRKFRKLVAIEPIKMIPEAIDSLGRYADEVIIHSDMPQTADETAARIGDADAALVSFTTAITAEILAKCPCLKYVGMCCSLYSPESANVDIHYADGHGITVTGIRDYGDEGVIEYVVSELARCLHGFGQPAWFGTKRDNRPESRRGGSGQVRRHDSRRHEVLRSRGGLLCTQPEARSRG